MRNAARKVRQTPTPAANPWRKEGQGMKRYYKTIWYGGATATITKHRDGTATLSISGAGGKHLKTYKTERGARVALGKYYDGTWNEVKGA